MWSVEQALPAPEHSECSAQVRRLRRDTAETPFPPDIGHAFHAALWSPLDGKGPFGTLPALCLPHLPMPRNLHADCQTTPRWPLLESPQQLPTEIPGTQGSPPLHPPTRRGVLSFFPQEIRPPRPLLLTLLQTHTFKQARPNQHRV